MMCETNLLEGVGLLLTAAEVVLQDIWEAQTGNRETQVSSSPFKGKKHIKTFTESQSAVSNWLLRDSDLFQSVLRRLRGWNPAV